VLVKAVAGLFADWPAEGVPIAHLSVSELAALRPGGVDAYLPTVLEAATFETWVVGGRDPGLVAVLLERGATVGTRIAPARLVPSPDG
jgi:aspartokinase-like uncharacterized kinase